MLAPYAIFDRAREAWMAERYPRSVAYTIEVSAAPAGGAPGLRHYHAYWSAWDNRVYVKPPVSDEQLEHPYKPPPGVSFYGHNIGGPQHGTGDKDFIGVPVLAPNYSFGIAPYVPPSQLTSAQLVAQIRSQYHDPAPEKIAKLAEQGGLKTIAVVSSSAHVYRISLAGIERYAGGSEYHLTLQPLEDPLKYRLRDLWIDTKTYLTQRARIAGNFTDAACERVSWLVQFTQIDGATYVSSETAEKPIRGYRGPMYSRYGVTFEIVPNGEIPPLATMGSVSDPLVEP